jgi:hypothetical protein
VPSHLGLAKQSAVPKKLLPQPTYIDSKEIWVVSQWQLWELCLQFQPKDLGPTGEGGQQQGRWQGPWF